MMKLAKIGGERGCGFRHLHIGVIWQWTVYFAAADAPSGWLHGVLCTRRAVPEKSHATRRHRER